MKFHLATLFTLGAAFARTIQASTDGVEEKNITYVYSFETVGEDLLPPKNTGNPKMFGSTVAINSGGDGNILAVGHPAGNGAVHIYELDGSTWNLKWTFRGQAGEGIGHNFALSSDGDRIAIRGKDSGKSVVRLYHVGTGDMIGTSLTCGSSGNQVSMSANGRLIALSCERHAARRGIVEFYYLDNNEDWIPRGSIEGANVGDYFGTSTSMSASGHRIAISAPGADGIQDKDLGSVGVYEYQEETADWKRIGFDTMGTNARDAFGSTVALSADGRVFAATLPGVGIPGFFSSVKTYVNIRNIWVQNGGVLTSQTEKFGPISINDNGSRLAVGSSTLPGNAYATDRVRVFNMIQGYWEQHNNTISWPANPSDPNRAGVAMGGSYGKRLAFATSDSNADPVRVVDIVTKAEAEQDSDEDDGERLGGPFWNIDIIDISVDFDQSNPSKEIRAVYEFGKAPSAFAVYEPNCRKYLDAKYIKMSKTLDSINEDKQRLTVELDIDHETIADSPVFHRVDDTSASINVCLRVDLLDEETLRPVVSEMNRLDIMIDTLDRFELTDVEALSGTSVDFEFKVSLDSDVFACQCNKSLKCRDAPLSVDQDARICVKSENSAVDIAGIKRLKMTQGSMSQTAIREGNVVEPFAKVEQVGNIVVIHVRLVSGFFHAEDPEDVVALGIVALKFKKKNRILSSDFSLRRMSVESNLEEDEETGIQVGFHLLGTDHSSSDGFALAPSLVATVIAGIVSFCFI